MPLDEMHPIFAHTANLGGAADTLISSASPEGPGEMWRFSQQKLPEVQQLDVQRPSWGAGNPHAQLRWSRWKACRYGGCCVHCEPTCAVTVQNIPAEAT